MAIKYRKLEIFSIILAIVALFPYGISAYRYFYGRPIIHYQITDKSKVKEIDEYIYDIWFTISSKKGKTLLDNLYFGSEYGVLPVTHPGVRGDAIQLGPMLEEIAPLPTFRINFAEKPLYSEKGLVACPPLRFKTKEDKKKLILKLIADTKVDPFKLGFWSIFQSNYNYRHFIEIPIDFENLNKPEGDF